MQKSLTAVRKIQNELITIIDTAASSDPTTEFAIKSIQAITDYVVSHSWKHVDQISVCYQSSGSYPVLDEVIRIGKRMEGFKKDTSDAWNQLSNLFGADVKHPFLLEIAQDIANIAEIKLDRDAKRRKSVLIKWYDENWSIVKEYMRDYTLGDDCVFNKNGNILTLQLNKHKSKQKPVIEA